MRMICNTGKSGLRLFACLLTFFLMLPIKTSATEQIDVNAEVSLTIQYTHENKPLAGASFSLYRVAEASANGDYTLTGDFKDYPVSLKTLDSESLRQLAITLDGYARRDDLAPLDTGKTDSSGTLVFPTSQKSLKTGLYLVVGQRLEADGSTYTAKPFLICLPGKDADGSSLNYHPVSQPKYNRDNPSDAAITRKVLKVWKDEGHKDARPKQIEVQLLKDGDICDTVTLTQDNNWRYTWDELDEKYNWTVVEKEVSNYKVSVTQEGNTFVITNTYDAPDTPGTPNTPNTPGTPNTSDTPGSPNQPAAPGTPATGTTLPQTGSLWWPVPWLLACGLMLLGIGILKNRREEDASC